MLNKKQLIYVDKLSVKRIYLLMKPNVKASLLKEALLEAKEEARKYREEVDAEFKSERQELKQIESRLTERATSLDRKDDNLTSKEQTLEQKNKVFLIERKTLMRVKSN